MAIDAPIWVDTWGWCALGNRDEQSHLSVVEIYQGIVPGQIKTSNFILDETISLLFTRLSFVNAKKFVSELLSSIERGYIEVLDVVDTVFREAWRLRLRYQDKPKISFTDFTSFAVMQRNGIQHVMTSDQHFRQVGMDFILLPEDL